MAKLSDKELAAQYGWALSTLNGVPELKKLFQRAVSKQYTPERFIAELRNTKWFKASSESQRKYLVLRTADPKQYVSQVTQLMQTVADQYSSMTGEVLPLNFPTIKNGKITDGSGFLWTVATHALSLGYNEAQIKDELFKSIDWQKKIKDDTLGGSLSGAIQQMRQQAYNLGIQPSEQWYADRVGAVALGDDTAEGALGRLKTMAKERYSAFADRIEAGETMTDISEGYRQSMAKVLELAPGEVDVFDSKIQNALTKRNTEGAPTPQSINDFEDDLRKDTRWQYTQNAKETLLTSGQNLLRSFGLASA